MKCSMKGCNGIAIKKPLLKLWAEGHSKQNTVPLKMIFKDLVFCGDCAPKVDCQSLVSPEGKQNLLNAVKAAGKVPPDFSSAEVQMYELDVADVVMIHGPIPPKSHRKEH